jgi:histidinol-phosphate aminotransferase
MPPLCVRDCSLEVRGRNSMTTGQSTFRVADLVGGRVQSLQEYAPEPLDETARRLQVPVASLIKADANENPYGPTPAALRALRQYDQYHRYPDPISRRLAQRISEYVGVPVEHILVGSGSDELIDLVLRLFRPGAESGGISEIIDCPPTFGMYAFYGATNDLRAVEIPRDSGFAVDIDAIEALCMRDPHPRVLFVASPNNPDGQLLPTAALERLLALPLLVVLDEAYVEFAGPASRASWVPAWQNLIVLRTFSKWAGLAGLRVGYGVFPAELMPSLWRLKSPYNVNGPAQAAALATLEDVKVAIECAERIVNDRGVLFERLARIPGVWACPSQANYVLCRLDRGTLAGLRDHMEARGILLRYYGRGGLEQCVRISVGTPEQNESIALALESYALGIGLDGRPGSCP